MKSTNITPAPSGTEFLEAARRYFEYSAVGNHEGAKTEAKRAAETCPIPQMAEGWVTRYQNEDAATKSWAQNAWSTVCGVFSS